MLPIDAAEELIKTPFTVELRLDGGKVTAKVYVAEAEIEGGGAP